MELKKESVIAVKTFAQDFERHSACKSSIDTELPINPQSLVELGDKLAPVAHELSQSSHEA